ncbi:ABC transporter substrate-binding protein [Litorilinea aerophila]|uniref:ABC transporter substrate-binding protein n=1 Tax=Litorilinea aerophila TaxID=1204385 RepID=A0A540V9M9_9CHLR|nr:ABC transporter substrate-binding protein [Litorilinea aerophila]MCC9078709.1 ABC transporter substrate-binding protein [Litorilinea aerophila]
MSLSNKRVSRRQFLVTSSAAVAGLALSACGTAGPAPEVAPPAAEAPPAAAAEPAVAGQRFKEAPMLAELVKAGQLPPVDERLPSQPMVVEVVDQIGTYGGTWRGGTAEVNGNFYIRNGGYQQLLRWTPTWDGIIPNLAEWVEANDEATEFTFKLREGIRYSDGEPLTADDILFWYEDVLMNSELTPTVPKWLTRDGEPVVVEKVDDYTVVFKFASSHGLFLKEATQTNFDRSCHYPRHYLEKYHPKYNPDIESVLEEEGYSNWVELFGTKSEPHFNKDLPVLRPWLFKNSLGEATARVELERNPYFWKVDAEGQQLPYIDRYVVDIVSDVEVLVLKALNGELDYQERFISAPKNKAVLFDNMEQGGYHFYDLTPTTVNEMIIQFNLNCTDPVKREIFRNKDFRIGLSHAINRQEIIDVVHIGQGEPWQAAPRPESRFHHERLAKQYTEYDVDLANEYLDKTGWTQRDSAGFRIGPDGNRISFIMEIDVARTTYVDALELIRRHWEVVGVEMIVKTMERSLWEERCRGEGLDFHASAHRFGGGSGDAVILDARYYLPMNNNSMYAKAWAWWYNGSNPELAEEPPEAVKRAYELYDAIGRTADDQEQFNLMMQILDIAADEFYCIGTVLEPNAFGVVTNRMRNTADVIPNSWIYPTPAPYNPEQFFVVDG